ncbi:WD repeat domain phosphoinositide-interacting protein 3, partial [Friedmanniomyces endolithicus]
MIWDDHQNKCIGELKFRTEVKAVKLRRDRIVVVLETKVFVYRFKDLKLIDQITTIANPKGLVSLCPDKNNVLAIPGLAKGSIRIELYDISKATLIKAHDADLAQFTLNFDGSRIASASEKGTLIRLWNCYTGEPLRELRRGMDRADIYCIAFNTASTYIA